MKVDIIYRQFVDHARDRLFTGGVETYLLNLGRLCTQLGFATTLYQVAAQQLELRIDGMRVVGVPVMRASHRSQVTELVHAARANATRGKGILVFGQDYFSIRTRDPRSVLIQHGVYLDLAAAASDGPCRPFSTGVALLRQIVKLWRCKRTFENCSNRVCVDHNFLSWYRAVSVRGVRGRVWVIPNFAHPIERSALHQDRPSDGCIHILFARRFHGYRGTRIIAEAARRLLSDLNAVRFTFAGEGPDEQWLRDEFRNESRVQFIHYHPDRATLVHSQHHIAVVPSLGSEGTSFAVAEALAAGCAVVATNIGGITNMILDGYNGLLVMPDPDALYSGLAQLVVNEGLRERLSARGYDTAVAAFSYERWRRQWSEVLEYLAGSHEYNPNRLVSRSLLGNAPPSSV